MNNINNGYIKLPDVSLEMAQQQQCHCQNLDTSSHINHNIKRQEYGLTAIESYQNDKCYSPEAKNVMLGLLIISVGYLTYSILKK